MGSNFFLCAVDVSPEHSLSTFLGGSWPKSSVHSGNLRKIFVFLQPGRLPLFVWWWFPEWRAGKVLFIDAIGVALEGWTGENEVVKGV